MATALRPLTVDINTTGGSEADARKQLGAVTRRKSRKGVVLEKSNGRTDLVIGSEDHSHGLISGGSL